MITAFTDVKPLQDMKAVIEQLALSENEMSCENRPVEFERNIVARTPTTWPTIDGYIAVQTASSSSESLALHAGIEIGKMSSVAVVSLAQLHVHSVVASPLNSSQQLLHYVRIIVPLYRYHERSLAGATQLKRRFPRPHQKKSVRHRPYRANPCTEAGINKSV